MDRTMWWDGHIRPVSEIEEACRLRMVEFDASTPYMRACTAYSLREDDGPPAPLNRRTRPIRMPKEMRHLLGDPVA